MKRIYAALAVYATAFFLAAAYVGWRLHETQDPTWKVWHVRVGLFAAIFVCFVHSVVFIGLLGAGLGIKRAIDEHGLREETKGELYRIKMRAFPPSMLCALATIVTAVLGGAALTGSGPLAHSAAAGAALVLNLVTFPIVVRQLGENERVLRATEAEIEAKQGRWRAV